LNLLVALVDLLVQFSYSGMGGWMCAHEY